MAGAKEIGTSQNTRCTGAVNIQRPGSLRLRRLHEVTELHYYLPLPVQQSEHLVLAQWQKQLVLSYLPAELRTFASVDPN